MRDRLWPPRAETGAATWAALVDQFPCFRLTCTYREGTGEGTDTERVWPTTGIHFIMTPLINLCSGPIDETG